MQRTNNDRFRPQYRKKMCSVLYAGDGSPMSYEGRKPAKHRSCKTAMDFKTLRHDAYRDLTSCMSRIITALVCTPWREAVSAKATTIV